MKSKRKDLGPAWRRAGVVAGAAVLALAAQGFNVSLAAQAQADRTVTVNELCNNYRAGYVPVIAAFTLRERWFRIRQTVGVVHNEPSAY